MKSVCGFDPVFILRVECLIYDITVSAVSDSDTLLVLMLRASRMPDSVPAGVCRNTASVSSPGSHHPHSKVRKVGLDELETWPWFSSSQLAGGGLLPPIWSPGALISARCLLPPGPGGLSLTSAFSLLY